MCSLHQHEVGGGISDLQEAAAAGPSPGGLSPRPRLVPVGVGCLETSVNLLLGVEGRRRKVRRGRGREVSCCQRREEEKNHLS